MPRTERTRQERVRGEGVQRSRHRESKASFVEYRTVVSGRKGVGGLKT